MNPTELLRRRCVENLRQSGVISVFLAHYGSQSTHPIVAAKLPYRVKVAAGKRYAWCACGHSKKQPFCDGAHKTKAPNISPLRFTPDKDSTLMLCACKQTKNAPYCDGSHFKVIFRELILSVKKLLK